MRLAVDPAYSRRLSGPLQESIIHISEKRYGPTAQFVSKEVDKCVAGLVLQHLKDLTMTQLGKDGAPPSDPVSSVISSFGFGLVSVQSEFLLIIVSMTPSSGIYIHMLCTYLRVHMQVAKLRSGIHPLKIREKDLCWEQHGTAASASKWM